MADFRLADAVDAAEALLQAVRIPGQVVVDHQVGALQVDAFASGVGRDQDLHFLVVRECFLRLAPLLAAHAAVDDDDRLGPPEQGADPLGQVVQGVAVLGEDDELAAVPVGVEHLGVVLEQSREFVPFAVGAGLADPRGPVVRGPSGWPISASQLGDGPGGGGLIDNLLLGCLDLGVRGVVQVVDVVRRRAEAGRHRDRGRASAPRFSSCSSRSRFSSRSRRRRSD